MKEYLRKLCDECKNQLAEAIEAEVKARRGNIVFKPAIRVACSKTDEDLFIDITELEYHSNDEDCFVFETLTGADFTTMTSPSFLRDLPFDRLYKIIERL